MPSERKSNGAPWVVALALLLAGCSTANNARWWSPATWFSAREAKAEDRALSKVDDARDRAVKAAQGTAHETQIALAAAPESRPIEVARESNDQTVTLLDQVAGPVTADEIARIRKQVAGLLSDNAALRSSAESDRASNRATIAEVSSKLAKAEAALEKAQGDLRAAFDRENALANELRNERLVKWGLAVVAVLIGAAWLYIKVALGGMPQAIGFALRDLRAKKPDLADAVAPFYAKYLSLGEQERIKKHAS